MATARSASSASRSRGASIWPWLGLATIIVIIDQFTKTLILGYYKLGDATYVTSFFNVVRAHNTGAAFSFLADHSGWQRWFFTAIGVAAAVFIVWMLKSHAGQKLFSFSMACILGGAIGNVIDRLAYGAVFDFIQFHIGSWSWYVFNVADAAIVAGVVGLLYDSFVLEGRRAK